MPPGGKYGVSERARISMKYNFKGFTVTTAARQLNQGQMKVWRPLYRIKGKDEWMIDNSGLDETTR
jgi:hypothetical protein